MSNNPFKLSVTEEADNLWMWINEEASVQSELLVSDAGVEEAVTVKPTNIDISHCDCLSVGGESGAQSLMLCP